MQTYPGIRRIHRLQNDSKSIVSASLSIKIQAFKNRTRPRTLPKITVYDCPKHLLFLLTSPRRMLGRWRHIYNTVVFWVWHRVIRQVITNVSEEHTSSIPWRWRQNVPLKPRFMVSLSRRLQYESSALWEPQIFKICLLCFLHSTILRMTLQTVCSR
jgi:hypothetical protein